MYLLVTDETNRTPSSDVKFFVYGGIFFPVDILEKLNSEIASIRATAGYNVGEEFKFDTRSRPERITIEAFTTAKNGVVNLCLDNNVQFIVHIIHHNIIANQDLDDQVTMAADYVIGRFNQFLNEANDCGICLVDNLPTKTQFQYLADKYQKGLVFPEKATSVKLDRIQLFGATCINASNINSAMDIVLGAFRYCINNPRNPEAASTMMKNVFQMMWGNIIGGTKYVNDKGLIIRPPIHEIRSEEYKQEYEELISHIQSLINK